MIQSLTRLARKSAEAGCRPEVKGGGAAAEGTQGEGNRGAMTPWVLLEALTAKFRRPENVHFTFMFMNIIHGTSNV